jgi:hypothetical protein
MSETINSKQYCISGDERGKLLPVEFDTVPFTPKRVFVVQQIGSSDPRQNIRGGHANKKSKQWFICVRGLVELTLRDEQAQRTFILSDGQAIFIDQNVWNTYRNRQPVGKESICMVLCSEAYNSDDYINDLQEFLNQWDMTENFLTEAVQWFRGLGNPGAIAKLEAAVFKVNRGLALSQTDIAAIAFVLFHYGVRQGADGVASAEASAQKIGCTQELKEYGSQWQGMFFK